MDYKVFEPNNRKLAENITDILKSRGYDAAYQRSYLQHAVYVKVGTKEEAERISDIIEGFMEKFKKKVKKPGEWEHMVYEVGDAITELAELIPKRHLV